MLKSHRLNVVSSLAMKNPCQESKSQSRWFDLNMLLILNYWFFKIISWKIFLQSTKVDVLVHADAGNNVVETTQLRQLHDMLVGVNADDERSSHPLNPCFRLDVKKTLEHLSVIWGKRLHLITLRQFKKRGLISSLQVKCPQCWLIYDVLINFEFQTDFQAREDLTSSLLWLLKIRKLTQR